MRGGLCWFLFALLMIGVPPRAAEKVARLHDAARRCCSPIVPAAAVGQRRQSPLQAPPLRTLSRSSRSKGLPRRWPRAFLPATRSLKLPEADEVGAIIEYLKSIQQR
jgi:hypothetical protein